MKPSTANFILTKVLGWHPEPNFPKEKKALILGVPHTSVWDSVIAFLYARANDAPMHILVKENFFFWPIGPILRSWGAIPLKKTKGAGGASAIMQMVEAFRTHDNILMGIAPEGTRKPVKKWKTGYHIIATRAGVPLYAGYINWKDKYVSYGDIFPLTDDVRADTLRLQRHYKTLGVGAKYPEKFVYDDEV
jgi:1-acyl-sn-glycerol-3-phosphate acyltransferase